MTCKPGKGGDEMSKKEIDAIKTITEAFGSLTEFDKGRILGMAEATRGLKALAEGELKQQQEAVKTA